MEDHEVERLVMKRRRPQTAGCKKKKKGTVSVFTKTYGLICILVLAITAIIPLESTQLHKLLCGVLTVREQRLFSSTAVFDGPLDSSYFSFASAESNLLRPLTRPSSPSYNGLVFDSLEFASPDSFHRTVNDRDAENFDKERKELLKYMEEHDSRSKEKYDPFDDLDFPRQCVRPQWSFEGHSSCMNVHDISYDRAPNSPLQKYDLQYLGHGGFRDAVLFTPVDGSKGFVIKSKRTKRDLDKRDLHKINTEALVFELMTASKVVSNMYAFCGSSIIVEIGQSITQKIVPNKRIGRIHTFSGRISQRDLDKLQKEDVYPMNDYSLTEKLDIAIQMAESLAEMHGFPGGVITNDDISLDQWLEADDGRIILNDSNDSIFMEWNAQKQEYCKYWRSFNGNFNAPEDYDGDYHDESIDIWPMGNLIFSLLTGLKPYYDIFDGDTAIQKATKKGPPYIDPRYKTRSLIEGRMHDIMKQCHKMNAEERVDIFEVVRHLKETRQLFQEQQKAAEGGR